ncbi:peptidase inhibitor family I36 protein [Streptomyces albidoflavus]
MSKPMKHSKPIPAHPGRGIHRDRVVAPTARRRPLQPRIVRHAAAPAASSPAGPDKRRAKGFVRGLLAHASANRHLAPMTVVAVAALSTALALAPSSAVPAGPAEVHAEAAGQGGLASCGAGQLCLWQKADFGGKRHVFELSGTEIESCVALPSGAVAHALANRLGRPVTTYQSAECAETGEFDTHPGSGTWQPSSPYGVRAFKIWEN